MIGSADASAQEGAGGSNPLSPISWLVGTWTGESRAPDGTKATSEVTYQWAAHKKAIKYELVRTSGPRVGPALEGLCGWHPGRKQLVLREIDSEGNLTEGALTVSGHTSRHEETIYGADGSTLPVRAELTREGEDVFTFKALIEKDGHWTSVFEAKYRRARP